MAHFCTLIAYTITASVIIIYLIHSNIVKFHNGALYGILLQKNEVASMCKAFRFNRVSFRCIYLHELYLY